MKSSDICHTLLVVASVLALANCDKSNCDKSPFRSIAEGETLCLERYLKEGGDPNSIEPNHGTLLIFSLNNSLQQKKCVEILLRYGADPNLTPQGFDPPLVMAALWADESSVKLLLAKGADSIRRGLDGKTSLECVGEAGEISERIRILLKK